MPQQFAQPPQFKTRTAVLLFLKGSAAPMILYFDNPTAVYEELTQALKNATTVNKIIEKEASGPIKKFCITANQISAVALQDEQYV